MTSDPSLPPRKRSSGFLFSFFDRIGFVPTESWDELTYGQSIFLRRDVLGLLETIEGQEIRSHYVLMHRGDRPVAAMACRSVNLRGDQLVSEDESEELASRVKKQALGSFQRRALLVGNLVSWGNQGLAIAEGEDRAQIWSGVADALYRIRRGEKLQGSIDYVIVKDLSAPEQPHAERLEEFGYRSFETDPNMVLQLSGQWSGFEDYLSALTSKYRKAARKTLKAVQASGWNVRLLDDLQPHADRLYDLYRNVRSRADVRLGELSREFLPALAECLGPERFRCSVIEKDDAWAGFVTTLKDRDSAIGYYLGLDYAHNQEIPAYHRLLQQVVEDAIALGCREISFGRTALDAKSRLGCEPQPFATWIRHSSPLRNRIVRRLVDVIPHEEAPDRSPFKESG